MLAQHYRCQYLIHAVQKQAVKDKPSAPSSFCVCPGMDALPYYNNDNLFQLFSVQFFFLPAEWNIK